MKWQIVSMKRITAIIAGVIDRNLGLIEFAMLQLECVGSFGST